MGPGGARRARLSSFLFPVRASPIGGGRERSAGNRGRWSSEPTTCYIFRRAESPESVAEASGRKGSRIAGLLEGAGRHASASGGPATRLGLGRRRFVIMPKSVSFLSYILALK